MCNAELRRVQAELKVMNERLLEAKRSLEVAEMDGKKQAADWRNHVQKLEAELDAESQKRARLVIEQKDAEELAKENEARWKVETDRIQMELNNTQERLHVQVNTSKSF